MIIKNLTDSLPYVGSCAKHLIYIMTFILRTILGSRQYINILTLWMKKLQLGEEKKGKSLWICFEQFGSAFSKGTLTDM